MAEKLVFLAGGPAHGTVAYIYEHGEGMIYIHRFANGVKLPGDRTLVTVQYEGTGRMLPNGAEVYLSNKEWTPPKPPTDLLSVVWGHFPLATSVAEADRQYGNQEFD